MNSEQDIILHPDQMALSLSQMWPTLPPTETLITESINVDGPVLRTAIRLKSNCEQFKVALTNLSNTARYDCTNSVTWKDTVPRLSIHIRNTLDTLGLLATSNSVQIHDIVQTQTCLNEACNCLDMLLDPSVPYKTYAGHHRSLGKSSILVQADLEEIIRYTEYGRKLLVPTTANRSSYFAQVQTLASQAHDNAIKTSKSIWACGASTNVHADQDLLDKLYQADMTILSVCSLSEVDLESEQTREIWANNCAMQYIHLQKFANSPSADSQESLTALTTDLFSLANVLKSKEGIKAEGEPEIDA